MNVQSNDLGDELRQGVHFCLDLAPVILCRPIARERLDRRELYSLGCICNRFSFRPLCRVDAPAQFSEFLFRNTRTKRTNRGLVSCLLAALFGSTGWRHGVLLDAHETSYETSDLSDEGIDDTFVSVRR